MRTRSGNHQGWPVTQNILNCDGRGLRNSFTCNVVYNGTNRKQPALVLDQNSEINWLYAGYNYTGSWHKIPVISSVLNTGHNEVENPAESILVDTDKDCDTVSLSVDI